MSQRPNTDPSTHVPSFSSRRARALITMLGADFAKTSRHPFFHRLVDLAVQAPAKDVPTDDPGLSASLQALVDRLGKPLPPDTSETVRQASDPKPPLDACQQTSSTLVGDQTLQDQHPAVIARAAKTLAPKDQAALLRNLSGATARQVLSILTRM